MSTTNRGASLRPSCFPQGARMQAEKQVAKVWSFNDCEWWVGYELEPTIAEAMKQTGVTRAELLEDDPPQELTPEALFRLVFTTEVPDTKIPQQRTDMRTTFQAELDRRVREEPDTIPGIFASTEF